MTAQPADSIRPDTSPSVAEKMLPSPDYVQSLARGLAVIRCFDHTHQRRTLSDVARATDLTRATARRFLLTLVELGYVATDGSTFWLTPRILELGYSYLSSLSLPEVAQPHLEKLSQRVHESTSVSILDGDDIVYVARVPVSRIMTVGITIGTRFPAYATSMGRVLLAGLTDEELDAYLRRIDIQPLTDHAIGTPEDLRAAILSVRENDYCVLDQELEAGLRSMAAPIRDTAGRTVAAVNISTHAARYRLDDLYTDLIPSLRIAAHDIEQDLATVNR